MSSDENLYNIILSPFSSERIFELIESQNKIAFIVNRKANKTTIRKAIEKLYNVKVIKINVMMSSKGKKKVIVKLDPTNSAVDLATALGLM